MSRGLIVLACLLIFASLGWGREDSEFDSSGAKLHYAIAGQGEPVLLLHGFAVNSQVQWSFPGIIKALSHDYRVITLDARGHGRSDKPHDPSQYGKAMVEDAVRLLDHLNIRKAHIVGYSMGGFVALKLAATHPERVLTLTTGGAGWSERTDKAFLDLLAQSLEQGKGLGPLIRELTPAGKVKPTDAQLKAFNQVAATFVDFKALSALVRAHKELEISEDELRKIQEPTLAIVGENDPFKPGVEALRGRIPNLRIVVIPVADHMDAFRKPQFSAALKGFLDQHHAGQKSLAGTSQ
jgi:pimeloyl-ACP methyl ester carboxylesterase